MSDELKPCPFCGSDKPYVSESDDGMARWVCCPDCDADGPPIHWKFDGTHDEARRIVVDMWNNRAQAVLEFLESCAEPHCECHDRDGSYVCEYCRSQGLRGHMER